MSWLLYSALALALGEGACRNWAPALYARAAYHRHALSHRFTAIEPSVERGGYRSTARTRAASVPKITLGDVAIDRGLARLSQVSDREFVLVGTPPGERSRTGHFLVRIRASSEDGVVTLAGYEHVLPLSGLLVVFSIGLVASHAGEPHPWLAPGVLCAIGVGITAAVRFQAALGKERALREAFAVIERAMS